MANFTLPNLTLKNETFTRNEGLQHLLLVDGLQINEEDSLYFSDSEDEELFMENTGLNSHTTVTVPLTQEWMSELESNVDDGYGPYFILEKFLESLPEYKTEVADELDREQDVEGLALQCDPGTGHNRMSCTYQCSETTGETVAKHISDADIPEIGIPSEGVLLGNIEQNTTGFRTKGAGLLPLNKVDLEGFMGQEKPVLRDDPGTEAWQCLTRSQAGSIYYSEEEDWMSEGLGHYIGGPDGDNMEERLAHHISSVPNGQQPDRNREGDPSEVPDEQSDCSAEEASYCYLLEVTQQYPLDLFEVDQQSGSGTEEVFSLLDPFEVPMVAKWQNSNPEHEAGVVKRLSRYDLFYGPTHRARSPSCPLIGERGDSRERSPICSDTSEVCVLVHNASQCHKGKHNGVRATRRTAIQTVTWKTHCSISNRTPCTVNPLLSCPCWLLLMGLPSLVTAMIDARQKLGKLLEKSPQGQPHWQPLIVQKTTLSSVNIQGGGPVLCNVRVCMATGIQLSGIYQWLPPFLCTYQCEP
ncbi:uncharacterized protein LOC144910748 [Branchiostoma floridae x Branchiostoma belcheri]